MMMIMGNVLSLIFLPIGNFDASIFLIGNYVLNIIDVSYFHSLLKINLSNSLITITNKNLNMILSNMNEFYT